MEKHQSAKQYIFASDFDQTLSFNDSGYVLAELLGIPSKEFERKATGMAKLNLVQQGGELAVLCSCTTRSFTTGCAWNIFMKSANAFG